MRELIALFGAVIIGICAGIQSPLNAGLGRLTDPKLAALLNFIVGGAALLIINLYTGSIKKMAELSAVPWYLLIGGLLGAMIVLGSIKIFSIVSAGAAMSMIVSFQLAAAVAVDHFGLFGVEKVPVGWMRIIGLVFMMIGIQFIVR